MDTEFIGWSNTSIRYTSILINVFVFFVMDGIPVIVDVNPFLLITSTFFWVAQLWILVARETTTTATYVLLFNERVHKFHIS